MSYTIKSIEKLLKAKRIGDTDYTIRWLLTDSRSLSFATETLFFALQTKRNDGKKFIPDLYARGVRNFVISLESAQEFTLDQYPEANFLLVSDVLLALQRLAELHREEFRIPIIGITGSNGKTIVKEWLYQLLSPNETITRSPRSYNSQIGVPLSVWQLDAQSTLGIFEAGISKVEEMRSLHHIIKPTIGILTNIGGAHQENFFSSQEKCMEKLTLFKNCDVLIYNGDDQLISNCVSKSMLAAREIAWSQKDMDRPLYISDIEKSDAYTIIKYRYLGMENQYQIPFIDDASIENSLNCLAACLYLMLSAEDIAERMAKLEPIAMRLEVKEGINGCLLINDSYTSDLASLDIALDFLHRRGLQSRQNCTLILSDILESGQSTSTLYRHVSQLVRRRGVARMVGVGRDISSSAHQFDRINARFFTTVDELIDAIHRRDVVLNNEIILLKGARQFHFDQLAELIELKVHETILEINLEALVDNLNYFKEKIKPSTKVMCMVKASAYGAGAVEIAKTLQDRRVDYLAVAVADEGAELRKEGITSSIIIMNPEKSAFKTMIANVLEPEVYSFDLLEALIHEVEKEEITNFPIHLKLDTGMHRLGFLPEEIDLLIERLQRQKAVIPKSVFSHFVGSDTPSLDEFTRKQIAVFDALSTKIQEAFDHKIIRHLCNTAAVERFPEAQYDMVRLGIGLYGIRSIDNSFINHVCTLKTTILQIHNLKAGETVGYGRKGVLTQNSKIAVLPIGYADGLARAVGNGNAKCLVNGQLAPYIGNICMDVCMIDVTGVECKAGDTVIIFGEQLPITQLSECIGTIPYEILTSISSRVKRVYFQG